MRGDRRETGPGAGMSDSDSFIDEVTEEVRRDRLFLLLRRWGWIGALLIVVVVGGAAWNEYRKAQEMARAHPQGPVFVAVNPGSLLASKMVREGFGVGGNDLAIGADILHRAALSEDFAEASGRYFDNDAGRFAPPHPAAANPEHGAQVMDAIAALTGDAA